MNRPVILAVDDEPTVLAAVARDLRREYGEDYRVLRAGSGEEALEVLRQLKLKSEPVALLVVDQRMPGMSGVAMLREAVELFPEARRVLLTAYADTEAAIQAINDVRLDFYLMKPWDPPEQHLYPVLTDLLDAWRAHYRPPFEGVRVVSHRWSADGHRVRDFLARNLLPYRWLDVEDDPEGGELLALVPDATKALPLVVFPDGSHLARPTNEEIAERTGLRTHADRETYDLLIVGAGPAGLAAAVYGASEGLRTLLVEREAPGGQAGMSSRIENYLGFPVGLSGGDLARRAVAQAKRFGAEIVTPREATAVRLEGDYPVVSLDDGTEIAAQALLIATGVSYRRLDVPGARELEGAGVFYGAAITEALAARDRDVFVVGGGNSAGQGAVYLARFARSVTVLVRGSSVEDTMSSYLIQQIEETPNACIRTDAEIVRVHGEATLEGLTVRDVASGTEEETPAAAVFIFIGAAPRTEWLGDVVARDGRGYILSGPALMRDGTRPEGWTAPRDPLWLETSVPGIFTAGDVRHRSIKRVASAVGEGSMAVQFIHTHLKGSVLAPRQTTPAAAG
ncbi:MAG: FAD-dependent oxidoreductase [Longimicrobiales bacterium]|nr:FAD-dependent oxidoreductase [Longimicrobiales bacterium]